MTVREDKDGTLLVNDEDFRPEIQAEYKLLHDLFCEIMPGRIMSASRGAAVLFGMFLLRLGIGMLLDNRMSHETVVKNMRLAFREVVEEQQRKQARN